MQRRFMRSALDTLAGVRRAAEYLRDTAPVHAAMLWRDERERAITCRHRRTQSPAAFILRSARFKKIERTTELNAQNKSREIQSEMCGKKDTMLRTVREEKGVEYAIEYAGHVSEKYIRRYTMPSEQETESALEELFG